MQITPVTDISYDEVISVLEDDGLVIIGFDTCYGVCCNPESQVAVDKLLSYKARPEGKAISIAVADITTAERYIELNETARTFYTRFLPGPFTIISHSKQIVGKGIESEKGTLGIRIPDNAWILGLLNVYNKAITSTSANQSYQKTPYTIADILDNLSSKSKELIDLIVDAGPLPHNPPSTVIDTTQGEVTMYRKGSIIPEGVVTHTHHSGSEADTIRIGRELLEQFKENLEHRPLIFALQGELGAGKTHFTKGVAEALGIQETIQSPTFILSREYQTSSGSLLYHIDTWRLEQNQGLDELGFMDMLKKTSSGKHNVMVIEWADLVADYLKNLHTNYKIVWIEIVYAKKPEERVLKWSE